MSALAQLVLLGCLSRRRLWMSRVVCRLELLLVEYQGLGCELHRLPVLVTASIVQMPVVVPATA